MTARTVDEVFKEIIKRRGGLVKALIIDQEKFIQQCNSDDQLYLYGLPNGDWELSTLKLREDGMVEFPPPKRGMNIDRKNEGRKKWREGVAISCDSWLFSVAAYLGVHAGFKKEERIQLFEKMNDIPTLPNLVKTGIWVCGACGKDNVIFEEGWIWCNKCNICFHGKCVQITEKTALCIGNTCARNVLCHQRKMYSSST